MKLLYILVTFVDSEFEYDEYECNDSAEVAVIRKQLEKEDYKFVSAQLIYA